MIEQLLNSSRPTKRLISIVYDVVALSAAYFASKLLRLGIVTEVTNPELLCLAVTIGITILLHVRIGLYRAILRFIGREAILRILVGVGASASLLVAFSFFFELKTPRSIPLIYLFTAFFAVGVPRLLIHSLFQVRFNSGRQKIIIYGAGYTGTQLALQLNLGTKYKTVAFVDDDKKLHGTTIEGLKVSSPDKIKKLIEKHNATKVLLALGDTPHTRRKELIEKLEQVRVQVQTVPPISDILSGKAKLQEIRDVDVNDLLGRDPIPPKPELMNKCISDKVVMVTGAGGSIGSELCRQIVKSKPSKLILHELNEFALYSIQQELYRNNDAVDLEIISLLGSVQNKNRLEIIMNTYGVQTVYHAAAYKHVPLVEHNIVEGVRNNVFGTFHTAEAAIGAGVETFILVSTDKAVRPTNIMGASKRMAELTLQALQTRAPEVCFSMVRFGNVLGSSGSVVPLFRRQIERGQPISVTHQDIIRYFMTIPEAAQLVIQAGSMAKGGEVFVLDMGEPVKIVDLAKKMIHLSGLTEKTAEQPNGDVEIQFSGLRPGEKLYEELLIGSNVSGTDHARIMMAKESFLSWKETKNIIQKLDIACHDFCCETIQEILLKAPTEFHGQHTLQDSIWKESSTVIPAELIN